MSMNKETFSIDLTQDDTDLSEKQPQTPSSNNRILYTNMEQSTLNDNSKPNSVILAGNKQHSGLFKSKVQNSVWSPEESAVSFLENLQKQNPQIETVFIESDGDDNVEQVKSHQSPVKIHNMVIIEPNRNAASSCVAGIPVATTNNKTSVPANKTLKQLVIQPTPSHLSDNLPFAVKSISPSRFNEKFANTSRIVALQEEGKKSQSKKFLVIPKEVASFFASKQGPVSLNIPGVGPILIPTPSDIFASNSTPALVEINNSQQELKQAILKVPKEPVYDPLTDQKYCWRYPRQRKRDFEGFTVTDRLGFYQVEQKRSKLCAGKYIEILKRLQLSITLKEKALMALKNRNLNIKNIKLVEIDSITGKKRNLIQKKGANMKLKLSPTLDRPKKKLFSSKIHHSAPIELSSSESDSSQISNNLLVTKKVVFLNKYEHLKRKNRRHKKRVNYYQRKKKMLKLEKEINRESLPNEMVYQATSRDKKEKIKIRDTLDLLKHKGQKKGKVAILPLSRRKKELSEMDSKKIYSQQKVHKIKPCCVEITYNNMVQKALREYNDYTLKQVRNLENICKIIDTLQQFQNEIQPIKPILVINEVHCASMTFPDLFPKYNLVFPMTENAGFSNLNITNSLFLESATKGYIKFVQPRILCRYLAGFREL